MEMGVASPEEFVYEKNFIRSLRTSEVLYKPEWKTSVSLKTDKFKRVYRDGLWVSCEHPKTHYEDGVVIITNHP